MKNTCNYRICLSMLAGITALETNPDIQVIIFDCEGYSGKKILSTEMGAVI